MSISSVSQAPPSTASLPKAQTTSIKPRDPDHDGDVDKAGQVDTDKSKTSNILNLKV